MYCPIRTIVTVILHVANKQFSPRRQEINEYCQCSAIERSQHIIIMSVVASESNHDVLHKGYEAPPLYHSWIQAAICIVPVPSSFLQDYTPAKLGAAEIMHGHTSDSCPGMFDFESRLVRHRHTVRPPVGQQRTAEFPATS